MEEARDDATLHLRHLCIVIGFSSAAPFSYREPEALLYALPLRLDVNDQEPRLGTSV